MFAYKERINVCKHCYGVQTAPLQAPETATKNGTDIEF